ncbi:unnamed protein product [Brassica oleracea]
MNDSDTKSQAASGYSPLSGPDSATQADVNRPLLTENSNPRPTLSLPSGPTTLFTIPKTLLTARTLNTRRTLTLPFASRPSGLTTLSLLEAPRTLLPSYQIESQATAGSPRRSDSNFSHSNSSRLSDTDSPRRLPFLGSGGVSTPAGDDEEVLGDPLLGAEAAVLADAKAWAKFLEVSNSFIQWMISTLFLSASEEVKILFFFFFYFIYSSINVFSRIIPRKSRLTQIKPCMVSIRDGKEEPGPRARPAKYCSGAVLGRVFLSPQNCRTCGTGRCGIGSSAVWAEAVSRDKQRPAPFPHTSPSSPTKPIELQGQSRLSFRDSESRWKGASVLSFFSSSSSCKLALLILVSMSRL